MNLGGVQTATVVTCSRCQRPALIPAGLVLYLDADEPEWCHETRDPTTGKTVKRAEPQ